MNGRADSSVSNGYWIADAPEGDALSLVVEDNGRGVANGASDGHGISSMRSRAAELGGGLEVTARENGGTAIALRVPAR